MAPVAKATRAPPRSGSAENATNALAYAPSGLSRPTLAQASEGIKRGWSDRNSELAETAFHLRDRGLPEVEDRGGEGGLGVASLRPVRERAGEVVGAAAAARGD